MTLTRTKGFWFPPGSPPEENRGKCFDLRALDRFLELMRGWERRMVVQAGGCIGVWPLRLANYFDTVMTFEPEPDSFHCLSLNCNGASNVLKFQAALGNRQGLAFVKKKLIGSHRIYRDPDSIKAPVSPTLELALDLFMIPGLDALILDVEGYEFRGLKGAKLTIQKYRPAILIEERKKVKQADYSEPLPGVFLGKLDYVRVGHIAGDGIYLPREKC